MIMKFILSGKYGELAQVHGTQPHHGIDLQMDPGTTIRSINDGIVAKITHYGNQNIGNGVIVKDNSGNYDIYGHLSQIKIKVGQKVHEGTTLGLSGNSGHSSGAHLHFGIQQPNGNFIDPTPQLNHLEAVTGQNYYNDSGFYIGSKPDPGSLMDKVNHFSNWIVGKEGHAANVASHPLQQAAIHAGLSCWHWFITYLPDLLGYGAIATGIFIILGSMFGKGGMIKPLAIFAGALIIGICILGSV